MTYPSPAYVPATITIDRAEAAYLSGFFFGPIAAEGMRMSVYFDREPAACSINVACFAGIPTWHRYVTEALEARRNALQSV